MPSAVRLLHLGASDVRDVLLGTADGGRKLDRGLVEAIGPSSSLEILEGHHGGWGRNLETFRSFEDGARGRVDVVVTSVSGELADPSPDPREGLIVLARSAHDAGSHVIVLNGSSVVPDEASGSRHKGESLSLRIRRLNLVAMEASHATGLSILDADRLVAENPLPQKVNGPFDYAPPVCEVLQAEATRILYELGFTTERSLMELRVPFLRQASDLTVERWLKAEGERIAPDDVICELRLAGIRRLTRPTNALVLASINGREPLVRRMFNRERIRQRDRNTAVSVVACEAAVLRKIVGQSGAPLRANERLALLTSLPDTPIGADAKPSVFRAVARTDDATGEGML